MSRTQDAKVARRGNGEVVPLGPVCRKCLSEELCSGCIDGNKRRCVLPASFLRLHLFTLLAHPSLDTAALAPVFTSARFQTPNATSFHASTSRFKVSVCRAVTLISCAHRVILQQILFTLCFNPPCRHGAFGNNTTCNLASTNTVGRSLQRHFFLVLCSLALSPDGWALQSSDRVCDPPPNHAQSYLRVCVLVGVVLTRSVSANVSHVSHVRSCVWCSVVCLPVCLSHPVPRNPSVYLAGYASQRAQTSSRGVVDDVKTDAPLPTLEHGVCTATPTTREFPSSRVSVVFISAPVCKTSPRPAPRRHDERFSNYFSPPTRAFSRSYLRCDFCDRFSCHECADSVPLPDVLDWRSRENNALEKKVDWDSIDGVPTVTPVP